MPKPVYRPRSTQPPQTATAPASPISPSGHAGAGLVSGERWCLTPALVRVLAPALVVVTR